MEQAMREMTADEWAAIVVGKSQDEIAVALKAAEGRGYRSGRHSLEGAVHHFEIAYRYAAGAQDRIGKSFEGMAEAEYVADAFEAAKIMAKIAYEEWLGEDRLKPNALA